MNESASKSKRPDTYSLEMIIVLAIITLHDFLLSNTLSIPAALGRIALARLISLDRVVSSLEFIVPITIFAAMLILWFTEHDRWVYNLAIVYLAWVTLRLAAKISLVSYIIASRAQPGAGVLLKDTIILWVANVLLFGTWYWIIDAGGPRTARRSCRTISILPFLNACRPCPAGNNGGPDFGITCFWDFAAVRSSA